MFSFSAARISAVFAAAAASFADCACCPPWARMRSCSALAAATLASAALAAALADLAAVSLPAASRAAAAARARAAVAVAVRGVQRHVALVCWSI